MWSCSLGFGALSESRVVRYSSVPAPVGASVHYPMRGMAGMLLSNDSRRPCNRMQRAVLAKPLFSFASTRNALSTSVTPACQCGRGGIRESQQAWTGWGHSCAPVVVIPSGSPLLVIPSGGEESLRANDSGDASAPLSMTRPSAPFTNAERSTPERSRANASSFHAPERSLGHSTSPQLRDVPERPTGRRWGRHPTSSRSA